MIAKATIAILSRLRRRKASAHREFGLFAVYQMPFLIVGSLLLESFFGIPGLGGLIYQAIQNADFPVIKAMTFIGAVLYMCFQLLSDVLYAVVDPKIQLR